MVRSTALAALLGLLTSSSPATAAEAVPRVKVRYSAPDICPDDAQLVASVERFLGQPLGETREQELSASVSVVGGANGFAAKLTFVSPRGTEERFAEDADCTKLAEAAALLVAIAVDPERVQARQAATEAPPPVQPPPAALEGPPARTLPQKPAQPPVEQPCAPPSPPPPVSERHLVAGLAGFLGSGIMPNVAPGVGVDFGARFDGFRAEIVGSYWFTQSAERAADAPTSIELTLVSAGVRACRSLPPSTWTLLACVQGELGQMSGSGQAVTDAHTQHALFGSLQALALAQYTRLRPAPELGLGLSWIPARPPFGISQQGIPTETFRPARFAVMAYLGVSLEP